MNRKRALSIGTSLFIVGFICLFFNLTSVVAKPTVYIKQDKVVTETGQSIDILIKCHPTTPIKAFEFKVKFNQTLYRAESVTEGDFFSGYQTFFNAGIINNEDGRIINIYNLIVGQGNVTKDGVLVKITFTCLQVQTSPLILYDVGLTNEIQYINITMQEDGKIKAS